MYVRLGKVIYGNIGENTIVLESALNMKESSMVLQYSTFRTDEQHCCITCERMKHIKQVDEERQNCKKLSFEIGRYQKNQNNKENEEYSKKPYDFKN